MRPSWTTGDQSDLEFFCLAAEVHAAGRPSNYAAQREALQLGLRRVDGCADPEEELAQYVDAMARTERVGRVLRALGKDDGLDVEVLLAFVGGRAAPRPVREACGDELAQVVMVLASPAELGDKAALAPLTARAAVKLAAAKRAYARVRDRLAVTR